MDETIDPAAELARAQRVQTRIRREGAWYPPMVIGFGFVTIVIVTALPLVRDTWTGLAFTAAVVGWAVLLFRWKARRDVRPTRRADTWRWVGAWVVLYVAATGWIGPAFLGAHVGLWALLGVVVAAPAFVEAIRVWRRDRR